MQYYSLFLIYSLLDHLCSRKSADISRFENMIIRVKFFYQDHKTKYSCLYCEMIHSNHTTVVSYQRGLSPIALSVLCIFLVNVVLRSYQNIKAFDMILLKQDCFNKLVNCRMHVSYCALKRPVPSILQSYLCQLARLSLCRKLTTYLSQTWSYVGGVAFGLTIQVSLKQL